MDPRDASASKNIREQNNSDGVVKGDGVNFFSFIRSGQDGEEEWPL